MIVIAILLIPVARRKLHNYGIPLSLLSPYTQYYRSPKLSAFETYIEQRVWSLSAVGRILLGGNSFGTSLSAMIGTASIQALRNGGSSSERSLFGDADAMA